MTHSPDHAERAAHDLLAARGWFPSAGSVPFDVARDEIAAALRSRDAALGAEEACPICEGKPMPAGSGCVAGCRDGIVLVTSANVLRNIKPLLERSAGATVEWEVWQDDMPVAMSTSEEGAMHYFMVYQQDGPTKLVRVERTEVARAALHDAKEAGEQGCGEGRDG